MKSLRRSFNTNGSSSSNPYGPASPPVPAPHSAPIPGPSRMIGKPSDKVAPPQKVIKALVSKRSGNPQELSYVKGDFWYVTGERDGWFEALRSRGLVPKSDFEEFAKGGRQGRPASTEKYVYYDRADIDNPYPLQNPQANPHTNLQFDFQAERPDELDAKQGEPIVIIAQSNHEWFVAKPIGRLGGPGLIPVTFVQIRDMATGKPMDTVPDYIPLVEEWKKATADYKAASIPLGHFDFGTDSVHDSPYTAPKSREGSLPKATYKPEEDPLLPPGELTHLAVVSFHNESGNYWFRVQVTFIPDDPTAPAYSLSLYRTYEDFYDFQISLLDTFPTEAGRAPPGQPEPTRILPFMPGPVDDEVDDELTEYRRDELDSYVRLLVELKEQGSGHIPRHELFRGFFAAKYGDYCESVPRDGVEVLDMGGLKLESRHQSRGPSPLTPIDTSRPPSSTPYSDSRSASGAGHTRAPSSAQNHSAGPTSQPPYVKIKVYDRSTDDLIALRVHPNISHVELFEKVRSRLGSEVSSLRYKTGMGSGVGANQQGGYREIRDDAELRDWMRGEDNKLVLYAEQ